MVGHSSYPVDEASEAFHDSVNVLIKFSLVLGVYCRASPIGGEDDVVGQPAIAHVVRVLGLDVANIRIFLF